MKDDNCIFCKLANGDIPTRSIYEDDTFRVFLDAAPATKGHALIVPKDHAANIYELPEETAKLINETKKNGGRVISVGTTSCRTLETVAAREGCIRASEGWTDIFIYPGFEFKVLDGLITNFHLPESTLIMLVSAFAGFDNVMNAYRIAVEEEYRFFSFGDAMLVL